MIGLDDRPIMYVMRSQVGVSLVRAGKKAHCSSSAAGIT